jgi:uncharacterized protein YceK
MRKILFVVVILLILVGCGEKSGIITSQSAEPGFIQAVYEGKCVMDEVPLWSMPGSGAEGAEQTALISGTCQGAPILMLQYVIDTGTRQYWYEVKQGEKQGWITSSFVVQELKPVSS